MSTRKPKLSIVPTAKVAPPKTDVGEITSRLGDCRGAVKGAIELILSGDPEQIDTAMATLCVIERELERLVSDLKA